MKNIFLQLFLAVIVVLMNPLNLSFAREHPAPTDIVEVIETTIVVSVRPHCLNPCPISERLNQLIKKYEVENALGMTMAGAELGVRGKGTVLLLRNEWQQPFVLLISNKLPLVKFRNGEIGIINKEIYIKERTEVLIEDKTYVFRKKKWRSLAEASPAHKE